MVGVSIGRGDPTHLGGQCGSVGLVRAARRLTRPFPLISPVSDGHHVERRGRHGRGIAFDRGERSLSPAPDVGAPGGRGDHALGEHHYPPEQGGPGQARRRLHATRSGGCPFQVLPFFVLVISFSRQEYLCFRCFSASSLPSSIPPFFTLLVLSCVGA